MAREKESWVSVADLRKTRRGRKITASTIFDRVSRAGVRKKIIAGILHVSDQDVEGVLSGRIAKPCKACGRIEKMSPRQRKCSGCEKRSKTILQRAAMSAPKPMPFRDPGEPKKWVGWAEALRILGSNTAVLQWAVGKGWIPSKEDGKTLYSEAHVRAYARFRSKGK